jgi:hypothetical protein
MSDHNEPHIGAHSEHGALAGEHLGRARHPVVKVHDLAWLEFAKPDLSRAEVFAEAFGFSTSLRTADELHLRGTDKDALAKIIGTMMTEGGEIGNLLRAILAPRLHLLPGFTDRVLSSETPPLHRSALVVRPRLRRALAGRLCPNASLEDDRRFDDVAGGRFALVTAANPPAALRAAVEQRGGVLVTARAGSDLHQWLRRGHATAALVRPDGTVLRAARDLPQLCVALPAFGAPVARLGKEP